MGHLNTPQADVETDCLTICCSKFADLRGRVRRAEDAHRSIARFERREHALKMRLVYDLATRSATDAESNLKA